MNGRVARAHWVALWGTLSVFAWGVGGLSCVSAEDLRELGASVSPHVARATAVGRADRAALLPMSFTLHLQHAGDLATLLAEQQRPGSPQYHHWLTPEEFAARFAPADDAYANIATWLRQRGFAVTTWPSRLRLDFTGTVGQAEETFQVRMNRYRHDGREVLANADAAVVPASVADMVRVARLNTFPLAHPLVRVATGRGTTDTMAPADMYTVYNVRPLLARGIDGAGQTVGVAERSDFNASDVATFRSQFGLAAQDPIKTFPATNPGIGSPNFACQGIHSPRQLQNCLLGEETEVLLDTEWAGAMAPGATVLVDISDTDIDLSMADLVNHHVEAKVIAISFGSCERLDAASAQVTAPLYAQAAAQGQTILVASGDSGGDECGDGGAASVNVLASDANVTAVGGTALDPGFDSNENATKYVSESVWNDSQGASGGGVSTLVTKPAYQAGPGVPADGFRDVPDVALIASPDTPGYALVLEGQLVVAGGTSAAAPSWAGIIALLDQSATGEGLGAVNTRLYRLARKQYSEGGSAVFHDITIGTSSAPPETGFAAGVGYDLATGWGSPDVAALALAFNAPTCVGDCNGDGIVTVDEILTAVNIALGAAPLSECTTLDANGDATVSVDEIVSAVADALNGCPKP